MSKPKERQPHGCEPYDLGNPENDDLGALSSRQQQRLNDFKIDTRISNEDYLRKHPEIECMLTDCMREVYHVKPANVREFLADYFTDPNLEDKVNNLVRTRQEDMKLDKK